MKNIEMLLFALPAVVMFGFTIFMKNIHEGIPKERAVKSSLTYSLLVAGFFIVVYVIKSTTKIPDLSSSQASQMNVPMRPVTPSRQQEKNLSH